MRFLAALVLLLALAGAAEPRASLPDIEDEVMCVECGTALNVSQSPVAEQERAFIRDRIAENMTKEEIKAALVEEYGPDVLAEPPGTGFNLTAWLVPAALAVLALAGVLALYRRWDRAVPAPASGSRDPDSDEARRLDAELAAFDR